VWPATVAAGFTFATGNKMVTVKTDQTNVSLNARQVATLIAGKF